MATSNVEEAAARLLAAFYDLAGGMLTRPVPLRDRERPDRGAASEAGLDPSSTLQDVALRYLLNKGYLDESQETTPNPEYVLTVAGVDEVRRMRGLDV